MNMKRWFCTLTDGRSFDFSATEENKQRAAQEIVDAHYPGATIATIIDYKPEYKH